MIVVSDTSFISALLLINESELLEALFGGVYIPDAVAMELMRFHKSLPKFVTVCSVKNQRAVDQFKEILDDGESEAIQLSKEHAGSLLLMDETLGRKIAKQEHLTVVGLMGVLLMAKSKGFLDHISPVLYRLENEAGFYLSQSVKSFVLNKANEEDL